MYFLENAKQNINFSGQYDRFFYNVVLLYLFFLFMLKLIIHSFVYVCIFTLFYITKPRILYTLVTIQVFLDLIICGVIGIFLIVIQNGKKIIK